MDNSSGQMWKIALVNPSDCGEWGCYYNVSDYVNIIFGQLLLLTSFSIDFSGCTFLDEPNEPNPDDPADASPASFDFPISSLERLKPIFIFPLFIIVERESRICPLWAIIVLAIRG